MSEPAQKQEAHKSPKAPAKAINSHDSNRPFQQQALASALQRAEFAPGDLTPAEISLLQKSVGNRGLGHIMQAQRIPGAAQNGHQHAAIHVSRRAMPGIQREFDLATLKSSTEKSDQETFAQLMALAGSGWEGMKIEALKPLAKLTANGAELLDLLQTLKASKPQFDVVAALIEATGSAAQTKALYNNPLRTSLKLNLNNLIDLHKLLAATGGNEAAIALAMKLGVAATPTGLGRTISLITKAGTAVQLETLHDKVKDLDKLDTLFQLTKDGAQLASLLNRVDADKLQELLENAKKKYHQSFYNAKNDQRLVIDAYENQVAWNKGSFPDAIASAIRHYKKWGADHATLKAYTDWCLETYDLALLLNCKPSTEGDAVTVAVKGGRNGNFGPVTAAQLDDMEDEQQTHKGRQQKASDFFGQLQILSGWK